MKVIEHLSQAYYLLSDSNENYLDVNCQKGPYSFSIFIRLNESELSGYLDSGRKSIEALAVSVMNDPDAFSDRNIKDQGLLDRAYVAILAYPTH